jgi:hypothetical protein
VILAAADLHASTEQVPEPSRWLNGLAFSNLTISLEQPGATDPAGTIDLMRKAVPDD